MARQRGTRWQADALVNGARKRLSFPTHAEAEAFERDPYAYLGVTKAHDTVGTLFPRWAHEIYKGTKNERNAIRITEELVRRLGPDLPVSKVDRKLIKDVIEQLRQQGNKDATVNTKMSTLSKLLHYGVDEEVLTDVPAIPFYAPKNARIRSLSHEEEQTLFSNLSHYHRPFATFLLYTGCRVSEAINLEWQDVTPTTVTFWRTKNGEERTIPLADPARAALDANRQASNVGPFHKVVYTSFIKDWHYAKAESGLAHDPQVVPHVLRHTCATRLAKGGMSELRLKKWLGHKTLVMVARYTHLDTQDLLTGLDALNRR